MSNKEGKPVAVLLHGLGRRGLSMAWLARALRRAGFETVNPTYPSLRQDLAGIVAFLHDYLQGRGLLERELHFVTHSMGGLVARAYIQRHRPVRLGRVAMLAPPNQGNEIADMLLDQRWWNRLSRHVIRRALPLLTTRRAPDVEAMLGQVDYPVGVIAGTTSIYSLGHILLPRPNDGTVSSVRTRLDGMADHIELPGTHSLLMYRRDVGGAVVCFLQHGKFERKQDGN